MAPRIAAPARPSPRIAAPVARSAPAIQRAAPTSRAASRIERRQQNVQSRSAAPSRASSAVSQPQQTAQSPRLQQLQSRGRLSRSERRELSTLQRTQRQNAQQSQPPNTASVSSNRLQQLQSKGRLSRTEQRELRTLQRDERQNTRQQQQNQPAAAAAIQQNQPRALRTRAVTAQQATQGRFASGLRANAANSNGQFAGRRAARLAARTAWSLGLLAPYVPWRGPVYYPYAYNDMFYYTFWPDAYDPGYWALAYDDMFDGVFFPDGAPYAEYAADGPYAGPDGRITTGSATGSTASRPAAPGRVTQATRDFCADQAKGVTAWPLDQIAEAVRPNEDQKGLLENLRQAADEAAAKFKEACPDSVPMTPTGRLQAMTQRLHATDEAIQTVKPAVVAFANSLSDEQKARFNEIGAQLGQPKQQRAANKSQPEANCSSEKAGISSLAINRMEDIVRPTETQGAALDKLDEAMQKAVEALNTACPNAIPQTPVGRLDVMQKRVEAMIDAANIVRPALDEFYTSLTDEQKAKLNRLGRETAQSGG